MCFLVLLFGFFMVLIPAIFSWGKQGVSLYIFYRQRGNLTDAFSQPKAAVSVQRNVKYSEKKIQLLQKICVKFPVSNNTTQHLRHS